MIPYHESEVVPRDALIAHAAIRVGDVVYIGWRHADIMTEIEPRQYITQEQQGFTDQYGNFYNRYQSARIALRARQVDKLHGTLISELLWDKNGNPL